MTTRLIACPAADIVCTAKWNLRNSGFVQRQLDLLKRRCPFRRYGCPYTGLCASLEEHRDEVCAIQCEECVSFIDIHSKVRLHSTTVRMWSPHTEKGLRTTPKNYVPRSAHDMRKERIWLSRDFQTEGEGGTRCSLPEIQMQLRNSRMPILRHKGNHSQARNDLLRRAAYPTTNP